MVPFFFLGVLSLILVVGISISLISLLVAWWHRRRVLTAGPVAFGPSQRRFLPSEHPLAPDPSHCPVCGAKLPQDTPQGLCPQCLMQCVLSHSDHGLAAGEGGATTPYPSLPAVPTPAELAPLFPELEILELLGQGGMGAVYKARQTKLDRLVAVKVLPAEWGRDPAFAERFAREARALARLNHPDIVSVHDFGEAAGHFYLIMEFVDGVNLRQVLATGRLQPLQALPIVAQVCDALQYAHEQGVVHRDIKPENILLYKSGRVKIADFGLAKLLRRSQNEFTLTGSRQIMGTLDYMAPEQRTTPQEVDHRADIYSLGVVFYEMLTGELPLGRFAAPSAKAPVDGRLDDVIFRALEREPDRRYQRISAVKADVESILRAESWSAAATAARRAPALSGPDQPAGPGRHNVRSFFLSVFSVFMPRSALGRLAATDEAGYVNEPADQRPAMPQGSRRPGCEAPPRKWRRRRVLFAAGFVACLFVGVQIGKHASGPFNAFTPAAQDAQPEGLLIGDLNELRTTVPLRPDQFTNVKQVLQGADREYLDMELRHTSRRSSRDPASVGHLLLLVTISPFPDEVSHLEERVWARLDGILQADQRVQAKKQLARPGELFAFGQTQTKIEIWQDGRWYHWKVTHSAGGTKAGSSEEGRRISAASSAPSETVSCSTGLSKYALAAAEIP